MKKAFVGSSLAFLLLAVAFPQEKFRRTPPIPNPPQELRLPAIETYVMNNGLTLAVAHRRDLPFISLELVVSAGESSSPETLPGLAAFTAEMMSRGTALVSAAEMEERIEAIGGSFSASVTLDKTRFSFLFLDEYLDQALEILSLMILQPAFDEREIIALRRTQFYNLRERQRDPEFVGYRQLLRVLFQGHPCLRALYNEDVFRNIGRRDIQAFYRKYYRPNNSVLVLAGNLNLAVATRKVSHYLNTWAKIAVELPDYSPPKPSAEGRVCFVELSQADDLFLFMGEVIFPRADPDAFAFSVLNQVLGGTQNSRLLLNLRESKEYAYYAFSQVDLFRGCGVFSVRARVVPSAGAAAVQEALKELDRIAREKVSAFEIEQAKQFLIGRFPLQLNRLDALAVHVSDIVSFDLGDAYWNGYFGNIMLVDSNKVFEVAQKYLLTNPAVVLVGNRSCLTDHLREIDRIDVYDPRGVFQYTLTKGVEE
jgi:predicted Zn-dependent peptidase